MICSSVEGPASEDELMEPDATRRRLERAAVRITGLDIELHPGDPMYRGAGPAGGVEVLGRPTDLDDQMELLRDHWSDFDFFFVHHKAPDTAGEDGDFDAKVAAIEAFDAVVPQLVDLAPDVLVVTGDHSTPSSMAAHSWHPLPVVLWGEGSGHDDVDRFGERWCATGLLGRRPSKDLMPILLAAAGRPGQLRLLTG